MDMKSSAVRRFMVAAVLMAATAFGAFAATKTLSLNQDLAAYVQAQGIDAQYLSMTEKQVPEDQWTKIVSLSSDARFVTLAKHYLRGAAPFSGDSASMKVGPVTYTVTYSAGTQYFTITK
jgi:hypothetical protein